MRYSANVRQAVTDIAESEIERIGSVARTALSHPFAHLQADEVAGLGRKGLQEAWMI